MDANEYKKKLLRTERSGNIYLDLRPFGERESEAIEFCLKETLEAVSDGRTREKIVVVCEPTTKIPAGANLLIKQIKEYRQAIEIHPEHRETSE